MKHIFYLFLFIIAILLITSPFSADLDKIGTMWAPCLEWEFTNITFSGNPFDLIATATFTHSGSGKTHVTELFYNGDSLWKLRFTGTRTGTWTFMTASSDPELTGHTGTVTITQNPNPNIKGFLTTYGTKFARQVGENGERKGFLLNVYQNSNDGEFPLNGNLGSFTDTNHIDAYIQQAKSFGFNTILAVVYNEWFKLGALTSNEHSSVDPDSRSFEALEILISRAHANEVNVHIWAWGDDQRGWTPIGAGGINGTPDKRIQRHLAARLGPMPGWTMSYGFDLEEWTTEAQLQEWSVYLNAHWGWKHLLWGRLRSNSSLDVVSNDVRTNAGYDNAVSLLNSSSGRPIIYERRHLYTRDGFNMDKTRRVLWQFAMAGGAAGWWGAYWGLSGPAYPNPEQLQTHASFWENRFLLDMTPDNSLTNGYCLKTPDNTNYVFYKENTGSIQIDLSGLPGTIAAVAVDAKLDYAELDISSDLTKTDQTWTAPYSSDWAIAAGSFDTSSVKKGQLKTLMKTKMIDIHPNPFSTSTVISLKGNSKVQELKIFDITGKEIADLVPQRKDDIFLAQYQWNAQNLAPGIYLTRVAERDKIFTRKLILLK